MKVVRVNFRALRLQREALVLWAKAINAETPKETRRFSEIAVATETMAFKLGGMRKGDRASRRVFRSYLTTDAVLKAMERNHLGTIRGEGDGDAAS